MSDCCPESELVDGTAQLFVEDDCTVVVEVEAGGPPGPQGPAATIAVGTTTTLAPNSPATVVNSGTSGAAIFDFGIPEGEAATIAVGTVTTVDPTDPATVTNSGSSSAAVFDFEIPQGDPGVDATIAVGTTTTLAPGSPATVANSGTSGAAIFDFGIPEGQQGIQGIQGIQGDAATVNAGSTTTLAPGSPATVANSGTTSAAVFDFGIPEGVQGIQGIQGIQGDAATIAVGTTTTVAPGNPAAVTNSGTSSAAIFDFDIPQGETGFIAQDNPPANTGLLWLDTDDPAIASLAVNVLSDFVAPYSYIGVAVAGSSTSSPVWRVTRIDVGPPVISEIADPIEWDDRLTAVYT